MSKQAKYTGYYNASKYAINRNGRRVYEAGNSPQESQTYIAPEDGVGLEQMKVFCETTVQEMATENNGVVVAVKFKPNIDRVEI